ncbi:MAG: flagellar biosynthesis protein FlgE [Aeromonadaceae bacterium]
MEINSAVNSGYLGLQRATQQVDASSSQIAKVATQSNKAEEAKELVNLNIAEQNAAASAKVVKSADEVMGTVIDVRV